MVRQSSLLRLCSMFKRLRFHYTAAKCRIALQSACSPSRPSVAKGFFCARIWVVHGGCEMQRKACLDSAPSPSLTRIRAGFAASERQKSPARFAVGKVLPPRQRPGREESPPARVRRHRRRRSARVGGAGGVLRPTQTTEEPCLDGSSGTTAQSLGQCWHKKGRDRGASVPAIGEAAMRLLTRRGGVEGA